MASFKLPCPSCENQVLISDASLIGTKVECPKCKYRFKAEEPAGGVPKDEAKGDKPKTKDKKKPVVATGEGKKKSRKLVAFVVGGLAVVILAVVGFAMLGGDKKPKTTPGGGGGGGGSFTQNPNPSGTDDGTDAKDKDKEKDKDQGKGKPKEEPIEVGRKVYAATDKDENATTNLLPGQTVVLYRFDFAKLRQTPLALLFDPVTAEMFQSSFGLRLTDISTYYHAFVGDAHEPFGLIRLRIPVAAPEALPPEAFDGAPKEIRKRKLYLVKANPFINGVSNAFSFKAIFGDYFDFPATATLAAARAPEKKPMGVCIYDSQHVLVGDYRLLQSFLGELDEKGFPKFSPVPAEKPMYRSIDYQLKKALMEVGSETGYPAAAIYAEKLVPGQIDLKLLKSEYQPVSTAMEPVLSRTRYLAASLNAFNPKQFNATIRFIMDSESSAVDAVKQHLAPSLTNAALAMSVFLNSPVEFRNLTLGESTTTTGAGTPPPGPGSGSGGYSERYGQQQQRPPGLPSPPPAPPPPTTSGGPKGTPAMPGPPGPGMMRPGMMQRPPGTDDPFGTPTPNLLALSHLDLAMTDQVVSITFDLNWDEDTYHRIIAPRLIGMTSSAKGKMAVFASELSYHALSAAVPKMLAATKEFPRGTVERKQVDAARMGLRYKPESCISFFVELLPYISSARASLTSTLDRDLAWFDEKNLHVAEGWVPELLVPHYPQTAWRANWPDTPGRVFGGTNYVAIAGVGLNAARLDPKKDGKKIGITGYEWGSKVDEVTDGLANTIYLMQTPPGLHQPWLAGGGATIRGLNEKDPMQGFRHKHGTPGGKEGTFALMGDGSVRFIPGDIKPDLLLAMATRAGGESFVASRIDKEAPLVYSPNKKKEAELKAERPSGDAKATVLTSARKPEAAPEPRDKK